MRRRPRIIVAGYLVRFPIGGYVWQALHYLLGFERLGCEVYFYEDSAFYPHAYDPVDIDPGVTQINFDNDSPHIRDLLAEHNLFFTVGENIGTPRCVLPTGHGLFAVRSLEDAVEAVRATAQDYPRHAAAAGEIARECFDASRVPAPILEAAGL